MSSAPAWLLERGDWKPVGSFIGTLHGSSTVDSQLYLEFNHMVRHAKAVITNSDHNTEKTTVMRVPCIALHAAVERSDIVTIGINPGYKV